MDPEDAKRTLEAIERARVGARRTLRSSWFVNVVLGGLLVGAGALGAIEPSDAIATVYWVGGLLGAAGAIFVYFTRRERACGIESRAWDSTLTLLAALIAALVIVNRVVDANDIAVAVCVVSAIAMAGFAWLARDPVQGLAAGAVGVLAVVFTAVDLGSEPGVWINLGIGAVLLAAGIVGRARERARAAPGARARAVRA